MLCLFMFFFKCIFDDPFQSTYSFWKLHMSLVSPCENTHSIQRSTNKIYFFQLIQLATAQGFQQLKGAMVQLNKVSRDDVRVSWESIESGFPPGEAIGAVLCSFESKTQSRSDKRQRPHLTQYLQLGLQLPSSHGLLLRVCGFFLYEQFEAVHFCFHCPSRNTDW